MKKLTDSNSTNTNKGMPSQESGNVYAIPIEGSLGLLALGAVGLKAWREKRKALSENKENKYN